MHPPALHTSKSPPNGRVGIENSRSLPRHISSRNIRRVDANFLVVLLSVFAFWAVSLNGIIDWKHPVSEAQRMLGLGPSANISAIAANLEHFWSFGRSPPVFPTPIGKGLGSWEVPYIRARALVAQMNNKEKNNLTFGVASTTNGCSGNIMELERVGFPGLCLQDSGNGVRGTELVNGYPSSLHVGAAWNKDLAYGRALHMGREFRRKGANVVFGPVIGPLGRVAKGGRNWEGFSNDPFLTGSLTGLTVSGLQKSVIACVKHFIAYEQETRRNPPFLDPTSFNQSVSSNLDDTTMHELYLWPFQDAVRAGAGSIMCSYNRINDSYGCQNSKTMNGLLKTELAFQGFVLTDFFAQHTGIDGANAGLDMALPNSSFWVNETLATAVANGTVGQFRLDDMVTRMLAAWEKYAKIAHPGHGIPFDLLAPHAVTDARDPASEPIIFQGAVEGHVLVKNVNHALPLRKPKFLSLFGYDAVATSFNTFVPGAVPRWSLGLTNAFNFPNGTVFDDNTLKAIFLASFSPNETGPAIAINGTMTSGGGSGWATPAYIDSPFDAIQRRAAKDGTFLAWDFESPSPQVNEGSSACLVFVNAFASEGWDRPSLSESFSDNLIHSVASQCNNTIVVIHNAGIRLVDSWINHPNVTAVLFAHLPGQDSGLALVSLLYGHQSPSGRLPYTVARREHDYGSLLNPTTPEGDLDFLYPQSNFTEGTLIDYRSFLAREIQPRFDFGFGLTYTTFEYERLKVHIHPSADLSWLPPHLDRIEEGGVGSLFDMIASVEFEVRNTGREFEAAEVAQLYISRPGEGGEKGRVLRGFEKKIIRPGKRRSFVIPLRRKDLSTWNVHKQQWVLERGMYEILVGRSVLDIQLRGSLWI